MRATRDYRSLEAMCVALGLRLPDNDSVKRVGRVCTPADIPLLNQDASQEHLCQPISEFCRNQVGVDLPRAPNLIYRCTNLPAENPARSEATLM